MQRNYSKVLWFVFFVGLSCVSCWATAASLHLLLSTWPKVLCYIVTIAFFIIASLGTKMIVDSVNQNIFLDHRGIRLLGGIVIVILFWLVCSMPTNTHTFFYRSVINNKVTTDIKTTKWYLKQIEENTKNTEQAQIKIDDLTNKVQIALGELEAEIKNEANPGFGSKSKEILRKIAALLDVDKIDPLSFKGTSKQDRDKLCDAYRVKIKLLEDNKIANLRAQIISPSESNIKEVKTIHKNLTLMEKYIADGTINLTHAEDVTGTNGVCDQLNEGYNAIKVNRNFINFSSAIDEAAYTADNPVTKVQRLISVFDVWKDYLRGEFKGYGFIFWIIMSVLVDLGAFICFDLAFRKTEY